MTNQIKKNRGVTLVEIIIAIAALGIIFATIGGAIIFGTRSSKFSGERNRAVFLASEGIEAVRNIRDNNFSNLSDGTYGLSIAGNQWTLISPPETIDGFTRTIDISTIDQATKEIVSNVSWDQTESRPGSVSIATRLTDWMKEVVVSGDWSSPIEESSLNISGGQSGLKIQVQGNYAYLVTSGGNPDFIIVDLNNLSNPVIAGSLSLSGGPRNIAVNGNYAYVVTNSNNQELQIIDISNSLAPNVIGSLNLAGNADANGIFYQNAKLYLVRSSSGSDELSIVDVADPASPSEIGSLNLNASAYEIYVSGSYVFISSANDLQEIQIIDISNPATPVFASTYNLSGNDDALSITGYNNYIIAGRSNGDVTILDITNPIAPIYSGNYNDFGDDINDIYLDKVSNYAFLASDADAAELQVIDISTTATPTLVGFLDLAGDLNGIAYSADLDRAMAVGDDNNKEFIILAPQ